MFGVAVLLPLAMSSPAATTADPGGTQRPRQGAAAGTSGATFQAPGAPTATPYPLHPPMDALPTDAPGEPGDRATRIRIDRLGLDLPIIEGDGIDVPLTKAAHFPGTAWPNGNGNIYLYAHARAGLFMALWNARVGDVVVLYLVNGKTRTYSVDRILPDVAWNDLTLLDPTPVETLTLQTCVSYGDTQPRFAVIAHPIAPASTPSPSPVQ